MCHPSSVTSNLFFTTSTVGLLAGIFIMYVMYIYVDSGRLATKTEFTPLNYCSFSV